ncbi:22373_t:CDS:2 [Rhizophagus irregularis]|nr:22373_t:CDS:2 [Rhizophagus irregularis]
MTNVYTLKDINNKSDCSFRGVGQRLGGANEQEIKEKLYSALKSKAEINDLSEKLVDKYNEREKEFENKASQLIASTTKVRSQLISERKSHTESQRELEAKYTAEIQSLKSKIKTLKREGTLARKASSADKTKILSLETKVRELEGKLDDLELEQVLHDSNAVGGLLEEPAQSDPKEIDSLRLELERVKEDLNSKEYTIECMEKGKEASDNIYKRELDIWSSERLKLMEKNTHLQELLSKKDNEVDTPSPFMNDSSCTAPSGQPSTLNPSSQIISVGGAEAVSLPTTATIIASSSMSPI